MTNQKHSGHYEDRIRNLFPDEISKMRNKELLEKAHQPVKVKGKNGKDEFRPGMSNTTFYRYLNRLVEKGEIKEIPNPEHPNDVYYTKSRRPTTLQLTEQIVKEITPLLERLPKIINDGIDSELTYMRKFEKVNQDIEKEIAGDKQRIGQNIASILFEEAFKLKKASDPELKDKDFYIDSEGLIAPKDLVDKRVPYDKRMKWLYGDNWHE